MRLERLLFASLLVFSASTSAQEAEDRTLVDENYLLKADREAFEELRKNIPAEKRNENDEKAFLDQMMSDFNRTPAEIRSQFSRILNKKRTNFQKDMTKKRELYTREEKKTREAFSKHQAQLRKDFAKTKVSSEERKEFFDDLSAKQRDFYAAQKEKRDEFEADFRDQRKNFDDYVKAKTDEFNQLHRDYTKRYEENKKALADQKKQQADKLKAIEKEYEEIKKQPATEL